MRHPLQACGSSIANRSTCCVAESGTRCPWRDPQHNIVLDETLKSSSAHATASIGLLTSLQGKSPRHGAHGRHKLRRANTLDTLCYGLAWISHSARSCKHSHARTCLGGRFHTPYFQKARPALLEMYSPPLDLAGPRQSSSASSRRAQPRSRFLGQQAEVVVDVETHPPSSSRPTPRSPRSSWGPKTCSPS